MVDDGMFDELEKLREENKQLQQDLDAVTKTACENLFLEKTKKSKVIKKLKAQIKDAEDALEKMNDKVVGREYGLDSEEIWEITQEYETKYGKE